MPLAAQDLVSLQRLAGNRAVTTIFSYAQRAPSVIQRTRGTREDPHIVHEKESLTLKERSLREHVLVQDVSGCAAIKISVFVRDESTGKKQFRAGIIFHSDGTEGSKDKATEIADEITDLKDEGITVKILAVTNGRYKSWPEHQAKVLNPLCEILGREGILYEQEHHAIVQQPGKTEDIDLTGTPKEIKKRYRDRFTVPEAESAEGRRLFKRYDVLSNEARDLGIFEKRAGKRFRSENPNYHKRVPLGNFSSLPIEKRRALVTDLEKKVNAARSTAWSCELF
jgi:hypothetical protein